MPALPLPGGGTTFCISNMSRDDEQVWLAASLAKTIKAHAFLPEDVLEEYSDEEFVKALYRAALRREISPDDLRFRLDELRGEKTR